MFVCLSVRPKRFLVIRCRDHIGWNTSKIISPQNSDKIVMYVEILAQSSAVFALI